MGNQHIWPAPSKDKDRVSDYVDARVPKTHPTILRRELEKMTDDNTSYVINPLKILIVGFEIQNELFLPPWSHEDKKKNLRTGLTGASRWPGKSSIAFDR